MQGNRAHIIKGKSLTYIYRFSRLDFFHKCINSLITVCRNSCFKSRIILISGKIYIYHSTGRTFSVICVVIVDEKAGLTAKVCGNYISGIVDRETLDVYKRQALEATSRYGMQYLWIMFIGLPPFMISQAYSSTLRECGETVQPMKAGVTAVLVNLVFNYLLIYGKFGFPELGVQGAAIATVLSRYVEAAIIIIWSHTHTEKMPFAKGLYSTLKVPANLAKKIMIKGTPLLLNETLWAAGMAILTQCYSDVYKRQSL